MSRFQTTGRAEDVGRRADLVASTRLFGRPEERRAADDRGSGGGPLLVLGEAEVADDDAFSLGEQTAPLHGRDVVSRRRRVVDDQQVRRLHVAMDDPGGVQRAESAGQRDDRRRDALGVA